MNNDAKIDLEECAPLSVREAVSAEEATRALDLCLDELRLDDSSLFRAGHRVLSRRRAELPLRRYDQRSLGGMNPFSRYSSLKPSLAFVCSVGEYARG
jgi:hypothetical protein